MTITNPNHAPNVSDPSPRNRQLFIWILMLLVIPLIVLFRTKSDITSNTISRQNLLQLLESGTKITGKIIYPSPGSGSICTIVGSYISTNLQGAPEKNDFQLKTRLTSDLEATLLDHDFEPVQPNNFLSSLIVTFLPILLVAGLIYFFLIRTTRLAAARVSNPLPQFSHLPKLDFLLLQSHHKPIIPDSRISVRLVLTNSQTLEGEILWADSDYVKFQDSTNQQQSIIRKTAIWKFEAMSN
jgi:preprotein translocase subunit YajC